MSRVSSMVSSKKKGSKKSVLSVKPSGISFYNKRELPKVVFGGYDKTPNPLESSIYKTTDDLIPSFQTGFVTPKASVDNLRSSLVSSMLVLTGSITRISEKSLVNLFDSFLMRDESGQTDDFYAADIRPLSHDLHKRAGYVDEYTLVLKETETFFLLDIESLTADYGSKEYKTIEKENELFDMFKEEKNKKVKKKDDESQTENIFTSNRFSLTQKVMKINVSCNVNPWQLYDFNLYHENFPSQVQYVSQPSKDAYIENSKLVKTHHFARSKKNINSIDEMFKEINSLNSFQESVCILERMLAGNNYFTKHGVFKGLHLQDPCSMDVDYTYSLDLLWNFKGRYLNGRTVSVMCWNPRVSDILAVGYGKFEFADNLGGMVCCWNIKNPQNPERKYKFVSAVTSLDFSRLRPNFLAIGLNDGTMIVLDITQRLRTIIVSTKKKEEKVYEPICVVAWIKLHEVTNDEEILVSTASGRIFLYRIKVDFTCHPLCRVSKTEREVNKINDLKECFAYDILSTNYLSALAVAQCPSDLSSYLIGTDNGDVRKYSTNNEYHHLGEFTAHFGPVYTIKYSPFIDKMFLTCGADWCIRLWMEGISEPLVTFRSNLEQIQDAVWDPTNSTLIASICGKDVFFWDLTRKTIAPLSVTRCPSNKKLTKVLFSNSGNNLIVGDTDGNVYVFGISQKPFSPFYQKDALINAIIKSTIANPELLNKLKKTYPKYFNQTQ